MYLADDEVPETGEIVVCKVTRVLDYGVFVELLEYENAKGFIHVSQVASRWVKNIRNFAKEGQMKAAKVLSLNTAKQQIDLSLTKVPAHLQSARIEEYKQFKRNKKLIELMAEQHKKPFDTVWEEVAEPLTEAYGSLYDAFQNIAVKKDVAASMVSKEWVKPLVELVEKNVTISMKTITGVLAIQSLKPNGIEIIKDALKNGTASTKDADVEIYYAGSGKYVLKVTSVDFKVAERVLKYVSDNIIKSIESSQGTAELERA